MSTTCTVRTDTEKATSDSFSLLVLGPPCCLEQLLDLWQTNSECSLCHMLNGSMIIR